MPSEPPLFENNKVCSFCGAAFTLVKRKHHCRMCGKTACDACSMKEAPIPAFGAGFAQPVRVCNSCYDQLTRPTATKSSPASASAAAPASTSTSTTSTAAPPPDKKVFNCTCGMPLCICVPDEKTEQPQPRKEEPKPKPVVSHQASAERKAPAATQPSFFNGFGNAPTTKYDLAGDLNEQCRDAVKNKDAAGVKLLLDAKADAKYTDSRGNTLIHLAAIFDKFDMVKLLIEHGADIYQPNHQGEKAVDLAPPAMQFKMQQLQPKK